MSKFKFGDKVIEKDSRREYTIREVKKFNDGNVHYTMREISSEYEFIDEDIELVERRELFS